MQNLLEFVEQFTLDEQLYFRIPRLFPNDLMYEVQWIKEINANSWRLRPIGAADWTLCSSKDLLTVMNRTNLDIARFDEALRGAILQQALFADLVLSKASEILGNELIEQGRIENQRFVSELVKAITDLTKISKEPERADQISSKLQSRPSLRIVPTH